MTGAVQSHYIDTWPGTGVFSAPTGTNDYMAWLLDRFRVSLASPKNGGLNLGVAQVVSRIIFGWEHIDGTIYAIGPHAADAAVVIEYLSGWTVEIEVR